MTDAASNIVSVFRNAAAAFPEQTALSQDSDAVSYGQLLREVEETAAWLSAKNISAGDKVLVFVPMSIDLYRIVLALFHLGACPVFLDEWVSLKRLRACLETVPCKGLIGGRKLLLLSWAIAPLRRIPVRLRSNAIRNGLPEVPVAPVDPGQTALITFTTGSTGTPKAANRTHGFLRAQLEALDPLLHGIESPCLTLLPIVVLLHLARGRATILPPRTFKAARAESFTALRHTVANSSPRSMIASPAIIDRLIESSALQKDLFAEITGLLTGGGPVYPDLALRMRAAFRDAAITAVYGSTEAEPISHIAAEELVHTSPETILRKGLPLGRADASAQVRILNAAAPMASQLTQIDFEKMLIPDGLPGEIIVAGPHVLRGYINNPGAEAATKIRVEETIWHRTGDLGRLEADGNLYLLGRVSETITWQGQQLYPTLLAYSLRLTAGIDAAAMLDSPKGPLLILERTAGDRAAAALKALSELGIEGVTVKLVKEIPRDPRHRTKVDYDALRAALCL